MKRLRIVHDDCAESPREWDNVGKMVCWHKRYNLGDAHNYDCDTFLEELACNEFPEYADRIEYLKETLYNTLYDCASTDGGLGYFDANDYAVRKVNREVEKLLETALANVLILPVYMYDHTGIALSTGRFGCPWDSGQVGFIYCTEDTINREFGGDWDKARKCLESEVSVYSDYANGDCFGYIVEESEKCDCCGNEEWEEIDSCWGYIGSEHLEDCLRDRLGDDFEELWEGAVWE